MRYLIWSKAQASSRMDFSSMPIQDLIPKFSDLLVEKEVFSLTLILILEMVKIMNMSTYWMMNYIEKGIVLKERTLGWTVSGRFDVTVSGWTGFNYIAFSVILLKKIKQTKKSR